MEVRLWAKRATQRSSEDGPTFGVGGPTASPGCAGPLFAFAAVGSELLTLGGRDGGSDIDGVARLPPRGSQRRRGTGSAHGRAITPGLRSVLPISLGLALGRVGLSSGEGGAATRDNLGRLEYGNRIRGPSSTRSRRSTEIVHRKHDVTTRRLPTSLPATRLSAKECRE
ncbi:hypothetical protein KM043_000568 [Ampulex compressa]|nr:hypothetical protein KM043_000568 [Ampulex compressa]